MSNTAESPLTQQEQQYRSLPSLPTFKVKDSGLEDDSKDMDAFVFCSDYGKENYSEYKKAYKLKTDYKFGNVRDEYDVEFERKKIKDVIHIITLELKLKAVSVPYILLPFRSNQVDSNLKDFLNLIFHKGQIKSNEEIQAYVSKYDEYTLMSALKFFWCRLPGNCVIGWKVYTKFSALEAENDYPKTAFLDYMPKCLSSGAHASIVYDFFDLIVTLAGNSQSNMMSGKKTCKVCGLWAFHPIRKLENGMPCFERGMFEWVPAADAMYHLLLSFLKALPPPQKGKNQKHLPDPITSLLRNNEDYPPPQTTAINTSRSLQEVPMVTLKVNNPSKTPAELLARVARTLRFDDATIFYTREDYLLLKRLFKDVNNLTDKLSTEGSRILDNMCIYDEDMVSDGVTGKNQIKFKLIPGWSTDMTADRFDDIQTPLAESNTLNNNNNSNTGTSSSSAKKKVKPRQTDFFTANVSRASIDDYFIWTWLASLGLEQTSEKKKTFGKTYIMEVQLAEGFKKWVIVEEQDVTKDGYDIELELKQERLRELKEAIKLQEKKLKVLKNDNLKIAGSSDDNDLDTLDQTIIDGIAGLGISSSSNPVGDPDNKSLPSIPTSAKAKAQPLPLLPGEKIAYEERTLPPTPHNNDNKHNEKMKSAKHPNGSAPTLPLKDNRLEYDDVNYLPIIATQSATASPSLASTESGQVAQLQLHHPNTSPIVGYNNYHNQNSLLPPENVLAAVTTPKLSNYQDPAVAAGKGYLSPGHQYENQYIGNQSPGHSPGRHSPGRHSPGRHSPEHHYDNHNIKALKNPQDPSSPSVGSYSSYETPVHGKTKQSPRRSDHFSPRHEHDHEHERFNSNSPSMEASSISSNRRPPPSSSSPSPSALAQGRQVAARDSVPVYRSPYGSSESLSDLHHAESDESEHGRSTTAIKNPEIASKEITSPIISVNGQKRGTDERPRSRIVINKKEKTKQKEKEKERIEKPKSKEKVKEGENSNGNAKERPKSTVEGKSKRTSKLFEDIDNLENALNDVMNSRSSSITTSRRKAPPPSPSPVASAATSDVTGGVPKTRVVISSKNKSSEALADGSSKSRRRNKKHSRRHHRSRSDSSTTEDSYSDDSRGSESGSESGSVSGSESDERRRTHRSSRRRGERHTSGRHKSSRVSSGRRRGQRHSSRSDEDDEEYSGDDRQMKDRSRSRSVPMGPIPNNGTRRKSVGLQGGPPQGPPQGQYPPYMYNNMYPGYPSQAGGYPPYGMPPQGYMGGPIPKGAHPAMGSPYMQGGYTPHSSYSLPPQRARPPVIGGVGGGPSSGPPSATGLSNSYPQLRVAGAGAGGKNDSVDGFSSNGSLVSPPSSNGTYKDAVISSHFPHIQENKSQLQPLAGKSNSSRTDLAGGPQSGSSLSEESVRATHPGRFPGPNSGAPSGPGSNKSKSKSPNRVSGVPFNHPPPTPPPQGYPYAAGGYYPPPPQGYYPNGQPYMMYPPQGMIPGSFPMGMPGGGSYPSQQTPPRMATPQTSPGPKSYSDVAIGNMPPGQKTSRLHGNQAVNKTKARDALMKGDFGI